MLREAGLQPRGYGSLKSYARSDYIAELIRSRIVDSSVSEKDTTPIDVPTFLLKKRDHGLRTLILLLVVLVFPALAQCQQTATITKWEMETYSQSAHIARNHVVYFVDVDGKQYKIARKQREDKPDFQVGDRLQVRFEKNTCHVTKANGKGAKYEVLGVE